MELESELERLSKIDREINHFTQERWRIIDDLRCEIKRGKSTGDKVKDYILAQYGSLDEECAKPLRDLEEKIKGNVGKQVLTILQVEGIRGCPGIVAPQRIDPLFIGIDMTRSLGFLKGDLELNVNNGDIIIQTENHVESYNNGKWKLKDGSIKLKYFSLKNLGKEVQRTTHSVPNDFSYKWQEALLLYVGYEVEKLFRGDGIRGMDLSYVHALKLLEAKIPEDFREKYDNAILRQKIEIINALEKGNNVIGYLKKAIELEMHIDEGTLSLRPGVSLKIGEYITNLCEQYKIKVS